MGHGHDVRRGAARARLHVRACRRAGPGGMVRAWRRRHAPRAQSPRADEIVVLTGDIVGSSRIAPERSRRGDECAASVAARDVARHWGDGEARFARFRGDGWQCLGPAPAFALRAALLMRATSPRSGAASTPGSRSAIGSGCAVAEPTSPPHRAGVRAVRPWSRHMPHVRRFAVAWDEPPDGSRALARRSSPSRTRCRATGRPGRRRSSPSCCRQDRARTRRRWRAALGIRQQIVARHLAGGRRLGDSRAPSRPSKNDRRSRAWRHSLEGCNLIHPFKAVTGNTPA